MCEAKKLPDDLNVHDELCKTTYSCTYRNKFVKPNQFFSFTFVLNAIKK